MTVTAADACPTECSRIANTKKTSGKVDAKSIMPTTMVRDSREQRGDESVTQTFPCRLSI